MATRDRPDYLSKNDKCPTIDGMTKERTVALTIRLPASLHAAIKRAAANDKRSASTFIVMALETAVAKAPAK